MDTTLSDPIDGPFDSIREHVERLHRVVKGLDAARVRFLDATRDFEVAPLRARAIEKLRAYDDPAAEKARRTVEAAREARHRIGARLGADAHMSSVVSHLALGTHLLLSGLQGRAVAVAVRGGTDGLREIEDKLVALMGLAPRPPSDPLPHGDPAEFRGLLLLAEDVVRYSAIAVDSATLALSDYAGALSAYVGEPPPGRVETVARIAREAALEQAGGLMSEQALQAALRALSLAAPLVAVVLEALTLGLAIKERVEDEAAERAVTRNPDDELSDLLDALGESEARLDDAERFARTTTEEVLAIVRGV
ncbi:hypothetical protein [Rubrivirga marina]|uniref:Uncharacterized protein n=1 Tax=Rubrivirga marina TaxID=1196024 RepID=A0A271IVQ1_9BACT|nr:hypothetical protein [Rubrivirga marina]PAP75293.1 hypothetical protein BSZ37_01965 [Rubrivirga marina]